MGELRNQYHFSRTVGHLAVPCLTSVESRNVSKKRLWACKWGRSQVRLMHQPMRIVLEGARAQTQAGGAESIPKMAHHPAVHASSRN